MENKLCQVTKIEKLKKYYVNEIGEYTECFSMFFTVLKQAPVRAKDTFLSKLQTHHVTELLSKCVL